MTPKVFIIEDDSMLQGVLIEMFTTEGYEAKGFATAEAAFEHMKEEIPDLILTDLVLPNMDGFDVLKGIKENLKLSGIPVIIMTNSGQDGDDEKAVSLGARDFIVKSNVSLEGIVERVKKVLSGQE